MTNVPLKNRMYGYELSGSEYQLIFEKDNMGCVRYTDKKNGIFCLDPSPFLNTPRNEIYVIKDRRTCDLPPKGDLIETTVSETERFDNVVNNEIHSIMINYVSGWQFVDPNKIRSNRLMNKEEFLDYMAIPFVKKSSKEEKYYWEDIAFAMGLYCVSSPQLFDFEPGGINTVVMGKDIGRSDWNIFKRISNVVPKEFRNSRYPNFYKSLETPEQPCPVNCTEVNLAYFNVKEVPIHIPLPLDVEFRSYLSYKDELIDSLPLARGFMLDALLFQPKISDKLQRRIDEAMYFVMEEIVHADALPYQQDIGSVVPKLTTAFARLDTQTNVTLENLNEGKILWAELMTRTKHVVTAGVDIDELYRQTPYEIRLLGELKELNETGMILTVENIKKYTKVPEWEVEKALKRLSTSGYIYYKFDGTIGIIEF
ncbi:hypothetical protein FQU78_02775 [Methanosarcina mazei]|uniref:Uncharacterized protein n=2 Tax=Methanosarcina mazei TaxID=2209 RepID=A0A6C0VF87_METMZ|nr:hypothetical protein FQU78_02775 [Methanosarcina mazei]